MLHPRITASRLRALLRQFPAVAILGPRQSGKSTLARSALPDYARFDLEDPDDYARLRQDPVFALADHRRVILDEAQRLPELFPVLRSLLDRRPELRIVLLGSASPGLIRGISESLAGRVGLLELGGISLLEEGAERLWVRGGFPRVHWSRPRARPVVQPTSGPAWAGIPQLGFRVSQSACVTSSPWWRTARAYATSASWEGRSASATLGRYILDIFGAPS